MKAKVQYSEFDLKKELESKREEYEKAIALLKREAKFIRKVKRINFTVAARYWAFATSETNRLEIYAPEGGWAKEEDYHKTLAILVRTFKKCEKCDGKGYFDEKKDAKKEPEKINQSDESNEESKVNDDDNTDATNDKVDKLKNNKCELI